ncbi:MAG TPA: EAL domain-containing protein [Thermoanaerobaculia bacterium]|nr:EAL domain-containing protein [Thermoanaerobaculia bacterium]
MKQRRPAPPILLSRTTPEPEPESMDETIARLRRDRVIYDGVTGLPIHPFDDPQRAHERIPHLGVIYLQIGKFFGFEELYGWELYDRVLVVVSRGIREDVEGSRLAPHLYSIRFSGADGFYVLYSLPAPGRGRGPSLENEASRLQGNAVKRLRTAFGGTAVDLMSVHASSLVASDNPGVRSSRYLVRQLHEAVKIVSQRQTREKLDLCAQLKKVIGQKQLRPAFQPLRHLSDGVVLGWEALIRGPQGSPFERPSVLFAVAQENDMEVELETLCLETIFRGLPRGIGSRRLFVNASSTLLRHPVFLDQRNLAAINRSHQDVVIEISEKEVVDYSSFGDILSAVRGAGLKIAIDDAGSGYSGLEAILNLRPDYIKVADSLVRRLENDPIKREIITSLAAIGRRIDATLVAEGIEREEERETLIALGVEYGQGFLLGRPAFQVSSRA